MAEPAITTPRTAAADQKACEELRRGAQLRAVVIPFPLDDTPRSNYDRHRSIP